MATISIIRVENPAEKAEISAHILHALPDWFGLPDSTQKYIDDSRNMPFFAAVQENQAAIKMGVCHADITADEGLLKSPFRTVMIFLPDFGTSRDVEPFFTRNAQTSDYQQTEYDVFFHGSYRLECCS